MNKCMKTMAVIATLVTMPSVVFAGDTLLTVSYDGDSKEYDLVALEALGPVEMTTTTTWTEGEQTFTGVPLSVILEDAGVTEGNIKATAINDYAVDVPVADVLDSDWPIVAYQLNGETMSVRDKGPLWIVYPYDSDPDYRTEVVYARSVWQLDRLAVER